jgi:hypothetical protein
VTIQIVRRWAMVVAGVALLCGLPVIASALPVSVPQLTASRARVAGGGTCRHTNVPGTREHQEARASVLRPLMIS